MKYVCLTAFALLVGAAPAAPPAAGPPPPALAATPANHNLTGVWRLQSSSGFGPKAERDGVSYTVLPYTPEFQAVYDKHLRDEAAGHPVQTAGAGCLPSGLGRMMTGGGPPLEILQNQHEVVVYKENGGLHRIHLDRGHLSADDLYPTFYGDAVGRWEGDTLVVDTIGLGAAPYIDGRATYSSEGAHIIERFRRVDNDTLEVQVTIIDPKAFTRPITATAIHKLQPKYELSEYYCTNERHRQGAGADQSVILPGTPATSEKP